MKLKNKPLYKKKVDWNFIRTLKYGNSPVFKRNKEGDNKLINLLKKYREKENNKHILKGESAITPTLLND